MIFYRSEREAEPVGPSSIPSSDARGRHLGRLCKDSPDYIVYLTAGLRARFKGLDNACLRRSASASRPCSWMRRFDGGSMTTVSSSRSTDLSLIRLRLS